MKPFSELFTNNFFVITVVVNICTQSIDNKAQEQYCYVNIAFIWKAQLGEILSERRSPDFVKVKNCLLKLIGYFKNKSVSDN